MTWIARLKPTVLGGLFVNGYQQEAGAPFFDVAPVAELAAMPDLAQAEVSDDPLSIKLGERCLTDFDRNGLRCRA
jgi:hypothetical protein